MLGAVYGCKYSEIYCIHGLHYTLHEIITLGKTNFGVC